MFYFHSYLFRDFSQNTFLVTLSFFHTYTFLPHTITISLLKFYCLCLRDLCPAAWRHVFVLDTRPLTSQARSVTVGVFGGTKAPRVAIDAASCPTFLLVVSTAHI